jgi:hypothetical protein
VYITDQIEFTEGLLKTLRKLREEDPAGPPIKIGTLLEEHVVRLRVLSQQQPDVTAQLRGAASETLQRGRGALGKLLSAAGERLKS